MIVLGGEIKTMRGYICYGMTEMLTSSEMRVDAHVARGSTQTLPFTIGDVLFGLWVTILFCHTKIDDMDN